MMEQYIRWVQRFQNFNKAFLKLENAVLSLRKSDNSHLQ